MRGTPPSLPLRQCLICRTLSELRDRRDDGAAYQHWFGAPDKDRFNTVLSNFEKIATNDFSKYHYSCGGDYCGNSDSSLILAYVDPTE